MDEILSNTTVLHSMLLPTTFNGAKQSSLIKTLLRVSFLQPHLLTILLQALPSLEEAAAPPSAPLSSNLGRLILTSIRWLDMIYDSPNLTSTALEVLSVCSKSMQQDLISILPDIIPDSAADSAVESLLELKQDDNTLLLPILDAVSSLRLSAASLELVTSEALNELSAADPASLPGIARFLMHHSDPSSTSIVISKLRTSLTLQASNNDDDSTVSSSTLTFETLSQGFQYRSDLTSELISQISLSTDSSEHSTSDIYLLLCAFAAPHNKNKIGTVIRKKCALNILTKTLLIDSIQPVSKHIVSLFPSYLSLADSLLRAPESYSRDLGGTIYSSLFTSFSDLALRQEAVAHLTTHVGSGTVNEVDTALTVLQSLASNDSSHLRPFSPFVTPMLDCMSSMTLSQTRRLFMILFSLNAEDSEGDTIQIILRKHLSHSSSRMKRVGIIGVTAFAVVRSLRLRQDNFTADQNLAEETSPTSLKEITDLLELAHDSCDPSKKRINMSNGAASPLGYFFDELALAIRGNQVAPIVKNWILDRYQEMLEDCFMGDFVSKDEEEEIANDTEPQPNNSDVIVRACGVNSVMNPQSEVDRKLLVQPDPSVRLHEQGPYGEIRLNEDEDDADLYLKILPFLLSEDDAVRTMPLNLVPLMRLLSALHDPRYGGRGLADIDAVIGAPLLLPASEQAGFNFQDMNENTKKVCVEATYHAVNWIRELLNSFVHDATFPNHSLTQGLMSEQVLDNDEIKTKIVQRLSTLVDLEDDLRFMASNCETYCPPNGTSVASSGLTSLLDEDDDGGGGGGGGGGENVRSQPGTAAPA